MLCKISFLVSIDLFPFYFIKIQSGQSATIISILKLDSITTMVVFFVIQIMEIDGLACPTIVLGTNIGSFFSIVLQLNLFMSTFFF